MPLGSAAKTGISVYMPCLSKKAYEAIMAAYTAASRRNGNKYIPLMQRDRLQVIVKGTYCGVVLDGSYNLTEATYKSSLQQLVNRVIVTDKDGKTVDTVQDAASRRKYGTVQRVYKQQDDVDNAAEARALLNGLERSGSVTTLATCGPYPGTPSPCRSRSADCTANFTSRRTPIRGRRANTRCS